LNIPAFLARIRPFTELDEESVTGLARCTRTQTFEAGERIIQAGDAGEAMYVIYRGEVQVRVTEREGERHIAFLGPGDMFGEMALITGGPRQADVYADTETVCVIVDKRPLYRLLRAVPTAASFMTELVGTRLVDGRQIRRVGKYHVLHEIGHGGMAIVYAGYHPQLRRSVAIKMLKHAYVFDEAFARQFFDEAAVVARLEHPNIVRVFDHEEAYGTQFIVMEMVEGLNLTEIMRTRPQMPEQDVQRIILQLADALAYAHKAGIVHRDVKPDNVMLASGKPLKLMDFGIARNLAEASDDASMTGTVTYMAPEQGEAGPIDGRADIYALGVMAYEMLTDTVPFEAKDELDVLDMKRELPMPDVRVRRPNVSDRMAEFIATACQADPDARFPNCAAIRDHFGAEVSLLRGGVRAKTITLLYDKGEEAAVRDALDALSTALEGREVLVSVARHTTLR
jgi:tRNA A-37 threonylcarbamoyl transferase component Bud32